MIFGFLKILVTAVLNLEKDNPWVMSRTQLGNQIEVLHVRQTSNWEDDT